MQAVPIRIEDHPLLYIDLRQLSSHFWLTGAANLLRSLPRPGYRFFELHDGGTLRPVEPAELKRHNQNVLAVPRVECARRPELG